MDLTSARSAVPTDATSLDRWLSAREQAVSDLVPGTEKTIQWANAPGERTDLVLVYLHGFSATRQETAPLTSDMAHTLGANAYWTRLRGHGRSGEAFATATVGQWHEDTAESLQIARTLGDRIVIIGASTGATLAAEHMDRFPSADVLGIVAISPNFGPVNSAAELLLLPWVSWILPPILGERSWSGDNAEHELYWTNAYPSRGVVPMMALVRDARDAQPDLPIHILRSTVDPVVDPARTDAWAATLPQSTTIDVPPSPGQDDHVLAGDILSPGRTDAMADALVTVIRTWAQTR